MASEQTFPPGLPSGYPTQELMSADFVESCGAILFDLTDPKDRKVCLIRTRDSDTWLIAKGRRNCGESRHQAALREVMEETGKSLSVSKPKFSTGLSASKFNSLNRTQSRYLVFSSHYQGTGVTCSL
ncbi:hypothetical protein CC80DRAFT_492495 [Byssothecium circinans]|uniref:Nudix hydrolase domain-containing protein n=1 Tax=Byssothecium circinans TaxID=147558 RepID=A0A6A5TU96_9PLEO|nr:hypothetical protein CC80DRAFT_492495 [Byssothecium circinans]